MTSPRHVHILGICGTFMGGIAAIARAAGFRVTGSDRNVYPPMSTQLESLGIEITEGFEAGQLHPAPDMVVVGNVMTRGQPVIEALLASNLWLQSLVWLSAPIVVGIALKVWNALRVEMSLEEQKRLLLEARFDALQRQINPHFLFNTLHSVCELLRTDPAAAEEAIERLAELFRYALRLDRHRSLAANTRGDLFCHAGNLSN